MNLHELRLPAGDHRGFDIDYMPGTGNNKLWTDDWLHEGKQGIRIIGEGPGKTYIRPGVDGGSLWETIKVGRHNGIVRLENLTVVCGRTAGVQMGWADTARPIDPHFKLVLRNVVFQTEIPKDGEGPITGTWGVFSYQCDYDWEDVSFVCSNTSEHGSYAHGWARKGARLSRVHYMDTGAENFKVRTDPEETRFVPGASIFITETNFGGWYKPWSSRGGGGVVLQASAAQRIVLYRCTFSAPRDSASHTRCLMVDNNGSKGFHSVGFGGGAGHGDFFANGDILVHQCAFDGGIGLPSLSPCIRVGRDGGTGFAARSLTISQSGIYGKNVQVQLSDLPQGSVDIERCNLPANKKWMEGQGMFTGEECYVALSDRKKPISEGHEQ